MVNNTTTRSGLFEGYKCLGLVSSSVPHLVRYIRKLNKIQIVTAVGRSFLVFNDRLQLIETCVAHSDDISVLAADSKFLFTASRSEVFAWKHGHKWKVKSYLGSAGYITKLLVFGAQLIGIDNNNNLYIWNIYTQQLELTLPFASSEENIFNLTAICHPATYINKIVLGSSQGRLQLWNVAKQKLIYEFPGWNSSVTVIEQSPAIHVLAIGHQSGLIVLHHMKEDQTLMKFKQDWGDVSSLTFRTDETATKSLLISSSIALGHLALWNLDEQRLESQMRYAHQGAIVGATFVNCKPLLVTNSTDNTLKVWMFDGLQTNGRILFEREGHRSPPTKIRFYGYNGTYILSAGLDSTLRAFSIYSERLNRNLGTASFNRKLTKKKGVQKEIELGNVLSPIIDYDYVTTREKEWDNIVAIHKDTSFVTTWSYDRKRMGKHKLVADRFLSNMAQVVATSVMLSACGHFVLVGYSSGHVDRFNIQSGLHRCSYVRPDKETAHQGPVRALASDQLNEVVISGGADRKLAFWRFSKGVQLGVLSLSSPVAILRLHFESNLMAVALDNFRVLMVDIQTKRVIRRLGGVGNVHANRITDMALDGPCRRLYVASMDSAIYVWDLMSGLLVDRFRVATPCVSLSISPSGEFLASAHVNDLAIYLWSNLSIYSTVSLKAIDMNSDSRVSMMTLPAIRSDEEQEEEENINQEEPEVDAQNDMSEAQDVIDYEYQSPEQISTQLVTLSGLAESRWRNLLNLDLIKRRNKPKEPVEKPKEAPFFLPTVSGLQPKFSFEDNKGDNEEENNGKVKHQTLFISEFARLLEKCSDKGEDQKDRYQPVIEQLMQWGPSNVDSEIRLLNSDGQHIHHLAFFLEAIEQLLFSGRHYELANSWLALFLKVHIEPLAKDKTLRSKLVTLAKSLESSWTRLRFEFDQSLCLINFLRNALIFN